MEDFYLMANREDQGIDFGNLPFPGLTGNDSNGNVFGEVSKGITGSDSHSDIESKFKSDFNLSSNTSETGAVFFEGNRRLFTNAFLFGESDSQWPYLGIALTGSYANPDMDGIVSSWLYYARGFTGGGITGATNENGVYGFTSGALYDEDLSPLFVRPMDLPTVPYGTYGSDTSDDGDGRATNKVLNINSTGETFSANFRSANTTVLFSINHDSGTDPDSNLLTVCTYRRDNKAENIPQSDIDEVRTELNRESFRQLNRGQVSLDFPSSAKYDVQDEVFHDTHTDLCFVFHGNDNDFSSPSGNVLKMNFPTPVRGFSIQAADQNILQSNIGTDVGDVSYRTVLEGDHVDGSTFTYIMYNRSTGGGASAGGTADAVDPNSSFQARNRSDAVSYLALNSRTDKHIQNLYVSVIKSPVGITYGSATHLDHGLTDMIGPARYYCNGGAFDGSVVAGTSGGLTLSDPRVQNTQGDTISVKVSVMPKYEQGHWQKEKRGRNSVGAWTTAIYNEWRKISRNQKGKTFGMTGSRNEAGTGFNFGPGVTFGASASTGSTLGITMGYRKFGDEFSNFDKDDIVEAFRYEVIKGTTVDGAFIPVWKKTRTI